EAQLPALGAIQREVLTQDADTDHALAFQLGADGCRPPVAPQQLATGRAAAGLGEPLSLLVREHCLPPPQPFVIPSAARNPWPERTDASLRSAWQTAALCRLELTDLRDGKVDERGIDHLVELGRVLHEAGLHEVV